MSRAAVIGTGYWGSKHIRVLTELYNEGLISGVVACDTQASRLAPYKSQKGVEVTDNIQTVLKSEDIEFVDIASPTPTHFSLSKTCLEAGKHVLVEKPMTTSYPESKQLIKIAEKAKRNLAVGHIFRYHRALIKLRNLIEQGVLGDIIHIDTNRSAFAVPRPDMGVLYALGIHDVDIACFLSNEQIPKSILCWSRSYYRHYQDEIANFLLKFSNGSTFSAYESWLNPTAGKTRNLSVIGTKASAKIDYEITDTVVIYDTLIDTSSGENNFKKIEEGSRVLRVESKEPLREEITDFIISSRNNKPPVATGLFGARAVFLIEKAFLSLQQKKEIEIDEKEL